MKKFLSRRARRRKLNRDAVNNKVNPISTVGIKDEKERMKKLFGQKTEEKLDGFDISLPPKMIIPGETLTDAERFVCSIHCKQCNECLRESKSQDARTFLKRWGSIFATATIAGAKVQRAKNCECFDGKTGTGAEIGIKVFAQNIKKFVDVIMKDPENRDFTVEKIEPIED